MINQHYDILLELSNNAVSWALFGLIWTVQLSHYPAFKYIDGKEFLAFHRHHTKSITIIVMPLMLLELSLAILFAFQKEGLYWLILVFVLLLWISTFFVQIPLHSRLGQGKNISIIQKLIRTNWFRSILWTLKALLVLLMTLYK